MRTLLLVLLLGALALSVSRLMGCGTPEAGEPAAKEHLATEHSIPSYALQHVRQGPLVPERMTPTILRATSATLLEGSVPDN